MHLIPDIDTSLTVREQLDELRTSIADTVGRQLTTNPNQPAKILLQVLSQEMFDRMCRDIASNIIQGLL